ncbi:methylated-DNA--[protein]-cysteine S-methyltransferase [Candidatus Methylocalor cossyra]|uniref:DNA-3-methyladenine glycosylase II n=1 Tax=Candidatus Methylocalor cossyra TaxID=3108543 RepID=A0ABP1CBL6_9GAMM
MDSTAYCLFDTPLGPCAIAWRPGRGPAVTALQLPDTTAEATAERIARETGASPVATPPPRIAELVGRIQRHLSGQLEDFRDVEVELGSAGRFAREVYAAARAIPAGQTRSYGAIAEALARPGAARAVGQALGKNPVPLIIPCHRVLAAGGRPGGFSAPGGIATKSRLLALEGVVFAVPPTLQTERDLHRAAAKLRNLDPRLAACLSRPIRFAPRRDLPPYAALFTAIVHQQLTPKAAAAVLSRVKALYPGATFPEPEALLNTPELSLRAAGLSAAKTAALRDLAARVLDGTVPTANAIVAMSDEEILARLTTVRGVGRWTAEMLLIFHLGRADVLPADDLALRKGVARVYGLPDIPTPRQLLSLGERWRPYRTVASLHLWNTGEAAVL